uniref:hypothetical protein n=1 Tax=Flavobacterium sp. TaxID=239 RepID=UPI004049FC36
MIIDINQKKISIGDKYKIFINERQTYAASRRLFKLLSEIDLFQNNVRNAKITLKKCWSFFNTKYDIIRNGTDKYEYRTVNYWKVHHKCEVGEDLYEIFGHRGRKFSIYKNDIQIAWWDKDLVSWFDGDNYKIIADVDADYELIISFCLINDNKSENDNNGNAITFNFGNLLEARKFNKNWKTKL